MPFASALWVAFMACGTRRGLESLCVAIAAGGAAMVDAAPAFVGNTRVRTIVTGKPVIGCMAARTIQAKHAGMEDRVAVAAGAICG